MSASLTTGRLMRALARPIAERTGLDFDRSHGTRMTAALHEVFVESGAADPADFLRLVGTDPEQHERLTDRLTVGETYFMREPAHFGLLRTTIAPERLAARRGPLRVWSAGCASGEEPYSVAIALDEAGLLDQATIVGSDLSERALDRAREALYSSWSLRRCDAEQRTRWFEPDGARFQLRSRYRGAVEWCRASLLDPPPVRSVDVVLCRNVLIYLTPDAVRAAAARLHDALAPGGWLLAGASDPVLEHRGLVRNVGAHGVAYRRLAPGVPGARVVAASTAHRRQRTSTRTAAAAASAAAPKPVEVRPSGALVGPAAAAATAAEPAELDADSRCLAAAAHLDAGRPHDAVREARAAVYLDPTAVGAHLLLAHAAEQTGDIEACVRDYRNALALLVDQPADAMVHLFDEPAGQVLQGVLDRLSTLRPPR